MTPLPLLQTMLAGLPAGAPAASLPAVELRFTLEFGAPPENARLKMHLAAALGSDRFLVEPFAGDALPCFRLLRFPDIERTLLSRDLFAIAYALCDALNLVSAEPDLGAPHFGDPQLQRTGREAESARIIGPLCWVSSAPPAHKGWALDAARVPAAWAVSEGEGILVAQPDTGIAAHDELVPDMFRLDLARDILGGDGEPTDPLRPGAANPGHGTGTASVLASRGTLQIAGAAPAARVVPIRCLEDVKVFNPAPVTAAILHARAIGAHVVSMSLGGVPSRAMHAAIQAAVRDDIIVISAAGNCIGTVVWPARYDDVIAVAGTNFADLPWKGSCRGSAVDIAAPAELVWRAERASVSASVSGVAAGQGTSFATALVAGIAALWLSAHGRDAVIAEARRRATTAQHLFRAALKVTARVPGGWNGDDMGPGIVDAAALLALPLREIPSAALPSARPSILRFLDETFGGAPADPGFDLRRYQAEIAAIALTQATLGARPDTLAAESKWSGTRPSPQLNAAVGDTSDLRLRRFGESRGAGIARPVMLNGPSSVTRTASLARRSGLESAVATGTAELDSHAVKSILDTFEKRLDHSPGDPAVDRRIIGEAERALRSRASPTPVGRIALEALIRLSGRPSVRVRGGAIDFSDPRLGDRRHSMHMIMASGRIQQRFQSVGRIDIDGAHVGTGFVIGDGLVLTNRHVVQEIAAPVPRRTDPTHWVLFDDVTIDFGEAPSSATARSRFRVRSVVGAGRDPIEFDAIDLSVLDLALLEVETVNAAQQPLPPSLVIEHDVTACDKWSELVLIGYPARPSSLPSREDGSIDAEVAARLNALFGTDYGTKYLSLGQVIAPVGTHAEDVAACVFDHDATSLVGSSGSAVIGVGGTQNVVGLHFGGQWLTANHAHSLAALRAQPPLMQAGAIRWSDAP